MAIAGVGAIAQRAHIPALLGAGGIEIVALQSRSQSRLDAAARMLWPDQSARPALYDDFATMLGRERPDAVGIFTPNHLHCEYALCAIESGAHVLCEKPMAPRIGEARRMVDAAAKARRVLMVTMQRRYGGIESAIKRAIDSGAIGQPTFIRARLSHGGPQAWAPGQTWFTTASEAGGGATLDLGVHVADLALWYLGDAESVVGQVATVGSRIEVDDTGAMVVRFKSGAMGVIEASWSSVPGLSAIEIYASAGRVMAGYPRNDLSVLKADGTEAAGFTRDEVMRSFDPRDLLAPFRALARNFVAAVAGRAPASPNGADGMRAVELVDACYRSSRSGVRVTLPLE
jgi:UDP-N-acetyl-2-amino-2-deoxyglucuronate dehydrogenase